MFPSVIHHGSLAKLRELNPNEVHTVIRFRSAKFSLFSTAPSDVHSLKVNVSSGPVREFTVDREVTEQFYVIQIPSRMFDHELVLRGGNVVTPPMDRLQKSFALLNQGKSPEEIDDGDLLIAQLRELIVAMRTEGDLPPDPLVLSDVRAAYFHGGSREPVFQVDYPVRRFAV